MPKTYNSDIRSIRKKVPKDWLIDGFFEENDIEKIEVVWLYDRNVITHLASTVGSYWLEPIATIPTPNKKKQRDAVDDINPPFDGSYYDNYDISEKRSKKIEADVCVFTHSETKEYNKKWDKCLEYCKENASLCM